MTNFSKSRLLQLLAGVSLLALVLGRPLPGEETRSLADAPMDGDATESHSSAFNRAGVYLLGFGCAVLLALTISVLAVLHLRHKRRMATVSPWRQGMSGKFQNEAEVAALLLEREALEVACEGFSNIIGSSSECVVYKGTLSNGTEISATSIQTVATNWSSQNEMSFRYKVKALARMKHPHLVNLTGYCTHEDPWTRIFVFEYASNGILYDHLHNKDNEHLNWAARMRIVLGAAYGLKYMHHELVPPATHLNFGADSVFLTDDHAAKLSNFGLMGVPISSNSSQKTSSFTLKSIKHVNAESPDLQSPGFDFDIHSFGVFLLEVITGRAPQREGAASLVEWAGEYLSDPEMMWYMVDPTLKYYNHDELVGLCKIVAQCLSTETQRPSMLQICDKLGELLRLTPALVAAKSTAALWAQLELQDTVSSEM